MIATLILYLIFSLCGYDILIVCILHNYFGIV